MQAVDNHLLEKLLWLKPQQLAGRRAGDDGVHAQLGQQLRLAFNPSERRGRLVGPQQPHRMRLEGEHDTRSAQCPSGLSQPRNQCRMPAVHAIKIADRNSPTPKFFRQLGPCAKKLQRRLLCMPRHESQRRSMPWSVRVDERQRWCTSVSRRSIRRSSGCLIEPLHLSGAVEAFQGGSLRY